MSVAGSLTYDTKLDTDGFNEGFNTIGSKAVAIGNLLADAFEKCAQVITDAIKSGIEYNAQLEQYNVALTTLTGSSEEASKIMEQIKVDASKTPFDVAGLTQANQLLISTGLSAEDSRNVILALGDAVSATGGGNDELSRMAVNLQQIKNTGKATALDIKQFAYAGIDIYGLLADYTGKTKEEVANMEVTWDDLSGALMNASQEGGKYFGAMEAQSKTLNGQISTLKDNASQTLGTLTEGITSMLTSDILPSINDFMGNVTTIMEEQGASGVIDYIIESIEEGIPELFDELGNMLDEAIDLFIDKFPDFFNTGANILVEIMDGITNTLPQLMERIPEIVDTIVSTLGNPDSISKIFTSALNMITTFLTGLINNMPIILASIPDMIGGVVAGLLSPDSLGTLLSCALQLIISFGGALITYIPQLMTMTPRIIFSIVSKLAETIRNTDWGKLGRNMLDGILNGLTNAGASIVKACKKLYNSIINNIKSLFGIHSPSTKMRDIVGKNLILGIGVSFEKDADIIDKQIKDFSNELTNTMQQEVSASTGELNTNASVMANYGNNSVVVVNATFDGSVEMDKQQVGRILTPVVTKTIKNGGGI